MVKLQILPTGSLFKSQSVPIWCCTRFSLSRPTATPHDN